MSINKQESISDRILSALGDVLYSARSQGYEPDSKFIKRYRKYVDGINSAYSKNGKARAIAKHIVPNEEEYNKKITNYPNYYKDELLASLLKLLELFREISLAPPPASVKKEKRIPTKDELNDFMDEVFGGKKINS
nr:13748_t:CDS:1 [Entrophospora candida]